MKVCFVMVFVACLLCSQGCSKDALKRTGYETVQNIGQQQCEKDLSSDCPERDSYEAYQRKVEEPETGR